MSAVECEFEADAYSTLMLHCYKHPALAVNGVLLGRESSPGNVVVVKAVPLFHGVTSLLPMLEAAMLQIDEYCASTQLSIVGYYHANERRADTEIGHVARKIGERLQARFHSAIIALVDNDGLGAAAPVATKPALTAYALVGNVWTALAPSAVKLASADAALAALGAMVAAGKQHAINDFDSHLDDVAQPWLDQKLAR